MIARTSRAVIPAASATASTDSPRATAWATAGTGTWLNAPCHASLLQRLSERSRAKASPQTVAIPTAAPATVSVR